MATATSASWSLSSSALPRPLGFLISLLPVSEGETEDEGVSAQDCEGRMDRQANR